MIRSRNGAISFVLAAVLLAGMVLAVYARMGDYPFVPIDDGEYARENPVAAKGVTIEGAAVPWRHSNSRTGTP